MAPGGSYAQDRLALAELRIAEAANRLALQEEVVAHLPCDTPDRARAEELLEAMRQSLTLMLTDRAMTLQELAGRPQQWGEGSSRSGRPSGVPHELGQPLI